MLPKKFLETFAADVTKRCGICQATVEQVLPAVFDEIRYRIINERYPCVPIDSFGTFAVINKPERRYHYYKPSKGKDEWRTLPPKKVLKFQAAYNFRKELERGEFDESRKAFSRHPQDPMIRRRNKMMYQPKRTQISISRDED